jgi:3-deoxy-manno-octulosonate cytidylyltransferase (CMP-KDO synthetase)
VVDFCVPVSLPFKLTESSVVAIIPARYQSTRLPAKPLADIAGRPMIEHVYRRASEARSVTGVIVATDDERIARAVEAFGGAAVMTRLDHVTGTDRLAEVAASLSCRVVVNVQGDEPLVEPAVIDAVVQPLLDDEQLEMATACRPLRSPDEFANPAVVKVVHDLSGRALYFSRAPIPHERDAGGLAPAMARAHVGLYAYRRDVLIRLAALPAVELERTESLEQLRALAHGIGIHVVETRHHSIGVDTPEDLARVRQWLLTESRS